MAVAAEAIVKRAGINVPLTSMQGWETGFSLFSGFFQGFFNSNKFGQLIDASFRPIFFTLSKFGPL